MSVWQRLMLLALISLCGACVGLSSKQRDQSAVIATSARSQQIDCDAPDRCARRSPLRALAGKAFARSGEGHPQHYALMLDKGEDALLARINLIHSASRNIDLQTYLFDTDDSTWLILDALLNAARRGIRVRILIDQVTAPDPRILAALSGAHRNLELRIYNPAFNIAIQTPLHYKANLICCARRFNARMHNKLIVIDSAVGIIGGRNYQDDYYDWGATYNFRDRDVLLAGPVARDMAWSFEQYWQAPRSIPLERLNDIGKALLRDGVPTLPEYTPLQPQRTRRIAAEAADMALIEDRLVSAAMQVGPVSYITDLPDKHDPQNRHKTAPTAARLASLVGGAQEEILMQTPYLALTRDTRRIFRELRQRAEPPRVVVSTNSLAATDIPIVYALSFRFKRRNMRELGFDLYEYKPFPQDVPVHAPGPLPDDPRPASRATTGSLDAAREIDDMPTGAGSASWPGDDTVLAVAPVEATDVRMGLHAKSMVVDRRYALIGTHNFDPRSDNHSTESFVIIDDPAFAQMLARSIERDIQPGNSWVVAPRLLPPVLSGLNYSAGKISETIPVLDAWPWRYAISYEYRPGPDCPGPLSDYRHPDFHTCYIPLGDFPGAQGSFKAWMTRILLIIGGGMTEPMM